jgi:hypothetical protein
MAKVEFYNLDTNGEEMASVYIYTHQIVAPVGKLLDWARDVVQQIEMHRSTYKGDKMPIKKLIVEEFEAKGDEPQMPAGGKYSYFKDPETGKYYNPKKTFEVTGENLEDLFEEIPPDELISNTPPA